MKQQSLFDMGFEDAFGTTEESVVSKEKKEAKSKQTKTAKSSKQIKKEEKIKLPCMVYGSGINRKIVSSDFAGKEEITLKELENDLVKTCGSFGDVLKLIPGDEGFVAVAYKTTTATKMDTELKFQGMSPFTVVYGELTADFFESDFSDKKVTLSDVLKKWIELHPEFDGCGGILLEKKSMIVPVFTNYIELSQELSLPASIGLFEQSETFPTDVSEMAEKNKPLKELITAYTENHPEVTHLKNVEILYAYCEQQNTVIPVLTDDNSKKVTVQYISLPVSLAFTFRPDRIELTPEQFDNKKKVTLSEIQEFTSNIYRIFTKDNSDFFYVEEDNLVVANRKSRTKGTTIIENVGESRKIKKIFPLIASQEELEKKLQAPYFLGFYQSEKDAMYRIEKNGVGVFVCLTNPEGDIVEGIECNFSSSLPKIPFSIYKEAVAYFKTDLTIEAAVQIWYNPNEKKYFLSIPEIIGVSKASISFMEDHELLKKNILVMDLHSHNTMSAHFSMQDNSDEKGCQLYGVVGNLNCITPSVRLRAGCEGAYKNLKFSEVFESEV